MIYIVVIVLFLLLLFIPVMLLDSNRFVKTEYCLEVPKLKKAFSFVLVSDLHNKTYGKENAKLLAEIEKTNPDAVMIAGDMLTSVPGKSFEIAADFVEKLALKYPIYYANGNHEYRLKQYPEKYGTMYEDYFGRLRKHNVSPLENENKDLEEVGITITGLEIDRSYYRKVRQKKMEDNYLRDLIGDVNPQNLQILIAHNPEYFEEYSNWGADLVLAGHIHGGIMRLPLLGGVISPALKIFPKYDGGLYHKEKSTMILSRGLGMHTIPIRIFNPGEFIYVKLLPETLVTKKEATKKEATKEERNF